MAASIDVVAYCGTDPPSYLGLTAGDIADALNFSDAAMNLPALAESLAVVLVALLVPDMYVYDNDHSDSTSAIRSRGPYRPVLGCRAPVREVFAGDVIISDTVASGTCSIHHTASAFPAGPTITVAPLDDRSPNHCRCDPSRYHAGHSHDQYPTGGGWRLRTVAYIPGLQQ